MTKERLHFHVIVDNADFYSRLNKYVSTMSPLYKSKIRMTKYDVWYPPKGEYLRNIFRECATELLFLPDMFPHLDQIIYFDTDTIFLRPPEHIFQLFDNFNSDQFVSMASEWYMVYKWPVYKDGLNSGVVLMDLQKIRQPNVKWTERMLKIIDEYQWITESADQ